MVFWAVNHFEPNRGQQNSQRAHAPKNGLPSVPMNEPAHEGRKQHERKILRRIENGRSRAALFRGKPRRDESSVARKGRRQGKTRQEKQREQNGEGPFALQITG